MVMAILADGTTISGAHAMLAERLIPRVRDALTAAFREGQDSLKDMLADEHDRGTPCNLRLEIGDRKCDVCVAIGRALPVEAPEPGDG